MTMESGDNSSAEKLALAKKICQSLHSLDRKVRKQAYVELKKFLSQDLTHQELRDLFSETHMMFLNGLRDKSEAVREQAIEFVGWFITEKLPLNDYYLSYVFPIILERIGTVELIEDSEEVRLQMLQLLHDIIRKYSGTVQLKPFLNDIVIILSETVKDKHPQIKELSCQTIVLLAKALPQDFHLNAETLIKPTLSCFTHQRYKVRVDAIKAIGEIVMHSSYKGVDEAMVPMAEKLFDQIPLVRQEVSLQSARWLLDHRDRYSYFHKMLPLLLTGLNDEVDATRAIAHDLWLQVGKQFEQENQKDLKDKLDYLLEPPKYYPVNLKRPNLGCRVLVQRNISKLAPAIANELTSWQEDVRVRCSQLLCAIALHGEEDLTFNLQSLFPAMYSAARDQDRRVVDNVVQAGEIIGLFVKFDTWNKLVLPVIEDGPHFGHIAVLRSLISGSPKEYISGHIEEISRVLAQDYICNSRKRQYQEEMYKCVDVLIDKFTPSNSLIEYNLFKILTSLIALKSPDCTMEFSYSHLTEALNISKKLLLATHSPQLFTHINNSPQLWTCVTDNACIFLTLLSEKEFKNDVVLDILMEVLDTETNAELKLKTYYVLAEVFEQGHVQEQGLGDFLQRFISDILTPCLVWRAGATAEAIRTMAATCLKFALKLGVFSKSQFEEMGRKLQPLLISLMEDSSYRSRLVAIECIVEMKKISCCLGIWWNDDLITVYPEILKRLDDPTEKVRHCALDLLPDLFSQTPDEFSQDHFKAHRELIVDTLMTHFDDDDDLVQGKVLEILKKIGLVKKEELIRKIELHRNLLRNQKGCDELMEFLVN